MLLFLVIAQLATPTLDFDLSKLRRSEPGCNSGATRSNGEIVVCGKQRATDIPIKAMPPEALFPKSEIGLFGKVRGGISGEQGNVGPIPTNRAMVTMTVPF